MLRGIEPVGVLPKLEALAALHRSAARAVRKWDDAREAHERTFLAIPLLVLGAGKCIAKLVGRIFKAAPGK